jgi:hypothetical protein
MSTIKPILKAPKTRENIPNTIKEENGEINYGNIATNNS